MKYQWKKEVPFAKAGTKVHITSTGCVPISLFNHADGTGSDICIDSLPQLIADGWIEEVKPREWYVLECNNPGLLWESEAIKEQLAKNPNLKFIKVREVIE